MDKYDLTAQITYFVNGEKATFAHIRAIDNRADYAAGAKIMNKPSRKERK